MPTPQSQLASRIAEQFGLGQIRFPCADCVVLEDGEVLKLFIPRSKRVMMGHPQDRMIVGDLMFILGRKLVPLRAPSKKFARPEHCAACNLANFPWLVPFSWLSDEPIDGRFLDGLHTLIATLPNDERGWQERFGENVFETPALETVRQLVEFLRKAVPPPRA
ncbi:MAG: hypothetical protein GC147_09590 [Porphyrobacter sp.]|nr:hypothetical protein [Porphyrobacter sp.]